MWRSMSCYLAEQCQSSFHQVIMWLRWSFMFVQHYCDNILALIHLHCRLHCSFAQPQESDCSQLFSIFEIASVRAGPHGSFLISKFSVIDWQDTCRKKHLPSDVIACSAFQINNIILSLMWTAWHVHSLQFLVFLYVESRDLHKLCISAMLS